MKLFSNKAYRNKQSLWHNSKYLCDEYVIDYEAYKKRGMAKRVDRIIFKFYSLTRAEIVCSINIEHKSSNRKYFKWYNS